MKLLARSLLCSGLLCTFCMNASAEFLPFQSADDSPLNNLGEAGLSGLVSRHCLGILSSHATEEIQTAQSELVAEAGHLIEVSAVLLDQLTSNAVSNAINAAGSVDRKAKSLVELCSSYKVSLQEQQ